MSEQWSPDKTDPPLPRYTPSLEDVVSLRAELHRWNSDGSSSGRFTSALQDPAYKVTIMGTCDDNGLILFDSAWIARVDCHH